MAEGDEAVATSGLSGLFDVHRPELLRFLGARCGDPVEAEDLLQELWLKLVDLERGPIANGRAYLFRMANNLALDRVRRRQRAMRRDRAWLEREPALGIGGRGPARSRRPARRRRCSSRRRWQVLRAAIATLPDGARRALRCLSVRRHGAGRHCQHDGHQSQRGGKAPRSGDEAPEKAPRGLRIFRFRVVAKRGRSERPGLVSTMEKTR